MKRDASGRAAGQCFPTGLLCVRKSSPSVMPGMDDVERMLRTQKDHHEVLGVRRRPLVVLSRHTRVWPKIQGTNRLRHGAIACTCSGTGDCFGPFNLTAVRLREEKDDVDGKSSSLHATTRRDDLLQRPAMYTSNSRAGKR